MKVQHLLLIGILIQGLRLVLLKVGFFFDYFFSLFKLIFIKGLDLNWCKGPETGLLKPDRVILLTLTSEAMARRGGFGEERYEIPEFQLKANKVFMQLKEDDYWNVIDADKTETVLNDELNEIVEKTIKSSEISKLDTLW